MIPMSRPDFDKADQDGLLEAFNSSFASGDGPDCRKFEKELSEYLGVKHVFFVTSCTAALDLAFMVKPFPAGSEVLVPNFTFTSTALAPILNGLKVVLVDVDPDNGNIDLHDAEKRITPKTVAISPVDYAGNPVDLDGIARLAGKHGLYVVHDAAQSIGATYKGRKVGTFGDVACFSFHGTKNLVVGEGGALVTNDDEIAQKVLIARDKGTDKHLYLSDPTKRGYYEYVARGNSYVQSNLLAGVGRAQLRKLDRMNRTRSEIASRYDDAFSSIAGVRLIKIAPGTITNRHLYFLLVPPRIKLELIERIRSRGVTANIHYNPLHMNRYYRELSGAPADAYPSSVRFYDSLVRIPLYPNLAAHEVETVIQAVCQSLAELL